MTPRARSSVSPSNWNRIWVVRVWVTVTPYRLVQQTDRPSPLWPRADSSVWSSAMALWASAEVVKEPQRT